MITSLKLAPTKRTKVLFVGRTAFIAKDMDSKLDNEPIMPLWFSRGKQSVVGNVIYGDVNELLQNRYLEKNVDVIVNYSVMKDSDFEENLKFIRLLFQLAEKMEVRRFIHISSMMVYPSNIERITEFSLIDNYKTTLKGQYARIKMCVDQWILKNKSAYNFEVSLLRPGFVYDESVLPKLQYRLFKNVVLFLGDSNSKLPVIHIDRFQEYLLKLCMSSEILPVINLYEPENIKRKDFLMLQKSNVITVSVPRILFLLLPKSFCIYSSMYRVFYSKMEALYRKNQYDNSLSMNFLNQH